MTTYSVIETSVHNGQPIECYEFIGPYTTYRYTSHDVDVIRDAQTYTSIAMSRSELKVGTYADDSNKLVVKMPLNTKLVTDYGYQNTPPTLRLILHRMHEGTNYTTESIVYWRGNVTGIAIEKNTASITIPSIFSNAMAGAIPSIYYQNPCNHVLYDQGCKVTRGSNMVSATVVSVVGSVVTISTNGAFADGDFIGGECADIAHNDRRTIVAHNGTTLTTNYPFATLQPGNTVEVTRGCNHAFNGDCKNKYANQINYGGFPFVPTYNVFAVGV